MIHLKKILGCSKYSWCLRRILWSLRYPSAQSAGLLVALLVVGSGSGVACAIAGAPRVGVGSWGCGARRLLDWASLRREARKLLSWGLMKKQKSPLMETGWSCQTTDGNGSVLSNK